MPAVEREFAFDIDVKQWSKSWKPQKKMEDRYDVGAKEVGCFSKTDGKIFPYSRKNLLEFFKPSLNTPLHGNDYEEFRKQNEDGRRWKHLEPHRLCGIDVHQYDIITSRNILVHLGTAVYEGMNSFSIDAVAIGDDGLVFAYFSKQESFDEPETDIPRYLGARFEVLCTGEERVDLNSNFCSFVEHKIGGHQVLFTAEIDCKDGARSRKPPMNYIELKCRLESDNNNRYMHKYMRYWLQSYLAGVPRIVEGVRDNEGKLLRLEEFETTEIPEVCKQYRESLGKGWNDTKILDFLAMTLTKISKLCRNNPEIMVQVKFDPKEKRLTASLVSDYERVKLWKDGLSRLDSSAQRRKDRYSTGNQVDRNSHCVPVEPERVQVHEKQKCWPWRLLTSCWHFTLLIFLLFLKQV